eukprot:m.67931 g.67931  ORF g.67931 m.67931 type:complete len:176 (-) comp11602_c1_seq1:111-638(-)
MLEVQILLRVSTPICIFSCFYYYYYSPNFYKIHLIMLALVVAKTLSSVFHAIDYHFIDTMGTEEEGWAVTFYVINFAKGMLLFLTVLLVGVGYGVIKNILSKQEKRLFLVVLPLQVFANVAAIVIDESSEGSRQQRYNIVFVVLNNIPSSHTVCLFLPPSLSFVVHGGLLRLQLT